MQDQRSFLYLSESPELLKGEFADGTNIPSGLNYLCQQSLSEGYMDLHRPTETPFPLQRWERLLQDLSSLQEQALPVGAILLNSRTPSAEKNGTPHNHCEPYLLCGGGSVHRDMVQLFDTDTQLPMRGGFPFLTPKREPIVFPDGSPIALRLGLTRMHSMVERPRAVHDDRKQMLTRLMETFARAGELLRLLPQFLLKKIFHRWGGHYPAPKDSRYLWVDSLFELEMGLEDVRGSVRSHVYDSTGYGSLVLEGNGLFPRVPSFEIGDRQLAHAFPSEAGYPFDWCATIEDTAASSLAMVDWLLTEKNSPPKKESGPLKVFISYCHADKKFMTEIERELAPLVRNDKIEIWHDKKMLVGSHIDRAIDSEIDSADILIFILSRDFLASEYCVSEELKKGIARASKGEACLIGVVARPCNWKDVFPSRMLALPENARAISTWPNRDEAWTSIGKGLSERIADLQSRPKPWTDLSPS